MCKLANITSPYYSILKCCNSWQNFSASLVKNLATVLKKSAILVLGIFALKTWPNLVTEFLASLFVFSAFKVMQPNFRLNGNAAQDNNKFFRDSWNRKDDSWKQFSENRQYLKVKKRVKEDNFKI